MPDFDEDMFFSPSGRYACRQSRCQRYNEEDCNKRSVHFVDFEEETYTEITLVTFPYYYIPYIYWLDDSHIGVLLSQYEDYAETNVKRTHRPKMALYEVDFSKYVWKPKKVIYKKKNEKNLPDSCCFHMIESYLTINGQDYLVLTKGWGNIQDPDQDPEYNDLDHSVLHRGKKSEYFWLRFIPKQFDTRKKLESLPGRCTGFARDNKLYTIYSGIEVLVMDINKYYNILETENRAASPAEFCSRVTIPTPTEYQFLGKFCLEGFVYIPLILEDKPGNYYMKVWDLDNGRVTSIFLVDRDYAREEEGRRFLRLVVHPSGQVLQIQHTTTEHMFDETLPSFTIVTNELFYFNFLPLKPNGKGVKSLQELANNCVILSKCHNRKKYPRCFREGRHQLTLKLRQLENY